MWKNSIKPDKPQVAIWDTRIACWITKATDTNSECVIHIAVPLPNVWLESASILRYTYDASLV
jgi:hypothetical protein